MEFCGVRNFYSNLERLCDEGSNFTGGYFALVFVATLLATGGLLANSIPVIIGSMCVAPFLGPSRSVCIGGLYRKWSAVGRGLVKQVIGLLCIGSPLAFFVTFTFLRFAPEITVTPTIIARTFPTIQSVYLSSFVALASGAAASLALIASPRIVSEARQELLDVMIGAEIAVSMIPPACVVGIGFAFGRADMALQAFGVLMINVVCLDVVTSMPVLYFGGVQLKPLQIEKKIREIIENTVNATIKTDQVLIDVAVFSSKRADVFVQVHALEIQSDRPEFLAHKVSENIEKLAGIGNKVKIVYFQISRSSSQSLT